MNKEEIQQSLREFAQPNLDLWPAIHAQLKLDCPTERSEWLAWPRLNRFATWLIRNGYRLRWSSIIAVIVLVIAGSAQELAQRETIVRGRASPSYPRVISPGEVVTEKTEPVSLISLPEAQRQAPFPIPLPTWLPEGLKLQGASVIYVPSAYWSTEADSNGLNEVAIFYRPNAESTAGVIIDVTQGKAAGRYRYPSSAARNVQINGQPAIYVRGAAESDGTWNETADNGMLLWSVNGFSYRVSYSELGLDYKAMIRIAESLR
jgi:hypothetical protein